MSTFVVTLIFFYYLATMNSRYWIFYPAFILSTQIFLRWCGYSQFS